MQLKAELTAPMFTRYLLAAPFLILAATPTGPATAGSLRLPSPPGLGIDPCKLLTKAQVETILPKHDGGTVAHAGGSMIAGVDAYQCSYADPKTNIFTVVVNVAVDDQRFAKIRPHFAADEAAKVPVGDGGWLRGAPDDMKLTAIKGRAVLDLELLAPDAKSKSTALVSLGQAAIAHL